MILNSFAKLNLYLQVLNKRKDGYHNLKTLFERISLSDKLILKSLSRKSIKITSDSKLIPHNRNNLAYQAAKLLQDTFKVNKGVEIKITKRIPVGAGLGGGSSNAATVLLGLNKLWKLNLSRKKLAEYAAKIGSDAAFFIYNCPFALAEGRGEKIKPLSIPGKLRLWHILVVPKFSVSTPRIYGQWDRERQRNLALTHSTAYKPCKKGMPLGVNPEYIEGLTAPRYDVRILTSRLKKNDPVTLGEALFNHLQPVTCRLYPQLIDIKNRMQGLGLKSILMSGSGPAMFALVSSRKEAVSVCQQLRAVKFWRIFLVRTQ